MTLDRTHCLYVTGSYIWWRYMCVPDLTPSVFPLIPPLQLITQIHMTHPQIPLYISTARRRSYNRFRLAVVKVSGHITPLVPFRVTSLLETCASVKKGVGGAVWHVARCVLPSSHLSPVVWPAGLLQLRGVHRRCCTAAPVNSILQGKDISFNAVRLLSQFNAFLWWSDHCTIHQ